MTKRNSHFLPGFLAGAIVGIIFCAVLYVTGPKPTYERVVNDMNRDLLTQAHQLEGCTAAYVKSHGDKLPKGTVVQGSGAAMIVVGYDQAVPVPASAVSQ